MEYKRGFTLKPYYIDRAGYVTFTDGTSTGLMANQNTCEAYGYRFDKASGTCTAFRENPQINRAFANKSIVETGTKNIIGISTQNGRVIGTDNVLSGNNNNTFIVGSQNEVATNMNNASIIGGTYGKVQRQSEVVIGGGGALGINQTSIVQLGGATTDATDTFLTVQSDESSFIAVQNNSIFGFEIKVIALCSGGSSGTVGDYAFIELTGAIKVNDGFVLTIAESSTTIASVGSTGTVAVKRPALGYMTVQVTGAADTNIEWFASVQITEKKLSSGTF